MKNIKYILLTLFGIVLFISCQEIENDVNDIPNSTNLIVLENTAQTSTQVADGSEYPVLVKVKLTGPSTSDVSGDITVTLEADASSTAEEGTHYRFDNSTITLSKSNNYLGLFEFTMLTQGIVTPLATSPILNLKVSSVSGGGKVIASGKPNVITLNYACPSDLAGVYNVTVLRDGTPITPYSVVTITETGVGTYRTNQVGHWDNSALGGTPGFTFYDVCSVISGPQQNLVELYSNQVQNISGSVDEGTGVITIQYQIWSTGWSSIYVTTYTPQ